MEDIHVMSWQLHQLKRNGGFSSVRDAVRWAIREEQQEQRSHSHIFADGKCVINVEQLHHIEAHLWIVKRRSDERKWLEAQQEVFGA